MPVLLSYEQALAPADEIAAAIIGILSLACMGWVGWRMLLLIPPSRWDLLAIPIGGVAVWAAFSYALSIPARAWFDGLIDDRTLVIGQLVRPLSWTALAVVMLQVVSMSILTKDGPEHRSVPCLAACCIVAVWSAVIALGA
jgi:hypothetical protein